MLPLDENLSVDAAATADKMKTLVARTGGDYSKLTHDERVFVEGVTANHGAESLRIMAEHMKAERKKAASRL